ncbi:hypothetical protein Pla22_30580 [Rubripirellula amarantea]|uniref:Uncharacterized protein n=1 Tax=Rubripirellula amarantea TaxID=2527999 RepID=A0A5C5WHN6_9BACT|nr:BBP7 family outer membrane beta-barrel protein [Rubripirellula amarantea]TWT50316.1 hypothetical protein Pla22_30580 [Rubripirellula amarantea]
MSVRKLTASLLTALAMLGGIAGANAQEHFNNLPPADPFAFDPDFRWFEPVYDMDLMDMKPKHRAATGWFATYDRLNLYGSNPETNDPNGPETKLDSGWGHRYEVGYMTPEDNGWYFNWTENSVAEAFYVRHEAANRYNGDQVVGGSGGGGAATDPNFGRITPPGEENNFGSDYRFFDVGDDTNVFSYNSFELNKTWRMEPYHYGGILEPLVGLRWMKLDDTAKSTRLSTFPDITAIPGFISSSPFPADQLLTDQSITENDLLGGQFGFRYFKFRDRFQYSADFKVFFGQNFQCARTNNEELWVLYGDPTDTTITVGDQILDIQRDATSPTRTRNEEFFVGFDLRGEIGYQLTKMITVRTGFQIIDIGTGVWRGGEAIGNVPGGDRDQDLVMVGGTFGLTLNR